MPEVTIGPNSYSVFADIDTADIYLAADVLRGAAWGTRTDNQKKSGLVSATRMMIVLPWSAGEPPPYDDAPQVVQDVCCMLAADLLSKPKLQSDASGNSNIKSAGAGSAKVEFWRPVDGAPPLPFELWTMLRNAGLVGVSPEYSPNDGPFVSGSNGPYCAAPGAGYDHPPYWGPWSPNDPRCC